MSARDTIALQTRRAGETLRKRIEAEIKVQIGCAYEGDFGKQLFALRRLPPGPPLVDESEPSIIDRFFRFIQGGV